VLGALITMAQRPWYLAYYDTTRPWGLTPLEDQQLAGLVMWVPAGFVYLAALVALFAEAMVERAPRTPRAPRAQLASRERASVRPDLVGTTPHAHPSAP
jgi:putative membrane protein